MPCSHKEKRGQTPLGYCSASQSVGNFHGTTPAFNLALRLVMIRATSPVRHIFAVQIISQIARDVARTVVAEQSWPVVHLDLIQPDKIQRIVQRIHHIAGPHARNPSQWVNELWQTDFTYLKTIVGLVLPVNGTGRLLTVYPCLALYYATLAACSGRQLTQAIRVEGIYSYDVIKCAERFQQ